MKILTPTQVTKALHSILTKEVLDSITNINTDDLDHYYPPDRIKSTLNDFVRNAKEESTLSRYAKWSNDIFALNDIIKHGAQTNQFTCLHEVLSELEVIVVMRIFGLKHHSSCDLIQIEDAMNYLEKHKQGTSYKYLYKREEYEKSIREKVANKCLRLNLGHKGMYISTSDLTHASIGL